MINYKNRLMVFSLISVLVFSGTVMGVIDKNSYRENTAAGYQRACWSCDNGLRECQGVSSSCKLAETWKKYAEQSCKQQGKCGINLFEVYNACQGGFEKAHWQCYDGYDQREGGETSCRSAEAWKNQAKQACKEHCQKISVERFSVFQKCRYA